MPFAVRSDGKGHGLLLSVLGSRVPGPGLVAVVVAAGDPPCRDVLDLPDVPGERGDERGSADEVEGSRKVQLVEQDGEPTVAIDSQQPAAVRQRGTTRRDVAG